MFLLTANKSALQLTKKESPLASGARQVYLCKFQFSEDWNGLDRTAVFRSWSVSRSIPLDAEDSCLIPWEVLEKPSPKLECGVYGTDGQTLVIPTIFAHLGTVSPGACSEEESAPPPTSKYAEILRTAKAAEETAASLRKDALEGKFTGADGVGLPVGGTPGQIPVKKSDADFDIVWGNVSGTDLVVFNAKPGQFLQVHSVDDAGTPTAWTSADISQIQETDPSVPAWAKAPAKPSYTAAEVGADPVGSANTAVASHDIEGSAHNDIRLLVSNLTARLNALANSDDTTLDQMQEIVSYIKNNKSLIDGITTGKISISDIVDNLTTAAANRPLSAKQGVALKALIDAIQLPTSLPSPGKLQFTGSVAGEYDGSADLSIRIPFQEEIDSTLTASGKAADAKAVGDALARTVSEADVEAMLTPYATKQWTQEQIEKAAGSEVPQEDLLPVRTTSHSGGGITYTPVEEGYHISGTASSAPQYAIYKDGMPNGMEPGKTYLVDANTSYDVLFTVTAYNAENTAAIVYNSGNSTGVEFTIPSDTVKLAFRVQIRNNSTVDMVFSPHIYAAPEVQYPKPMLTIVDDDGYQKFATLLLPIIREKACPIGTAIIGQNVGETFAMGTETIKACAMEGAEILSHSWSHLTEAKATDMEQYAIQHDYQKMKNYLAAIGTGTDGLVYCGNSSTLAPCQAAAKQVYSYALNPGANKVNQKYSTPRYNIARFGIDAGVNLTASHLHTLLDDLAEAGTGWMVWTIHTSDNNFQQAQADTLSAAIDYARNKGISLVTTAYGVAQYVVD